MRHGPGSPPPRAARDSGGGWGWAGSGRCSGGELWAWPPSEAAPPSGERRSSLNQRTVCQDPLCFLVFRLSKWEPTRSPQSAEAPDAVCTGYPHSGAAISSFPRLVRMPPAPASAALPQLQPSGPCLQATYALRSEYRVPPDLCTPSIPCLSWLLHASHSEFHVFRDICKSSTWNSVSFTAFAHTPLRIPGPRLPLALTPSRKVFWGLIRQRCLA